jgi:hypothetical protein
MWISSGRITNPALNQVLLDTGALAAKERLFQVFVSSTVAIPLEVQWRDATDTATLKSQIIAVPASTFVQMFQFLSEIPMAANERLRIIAVSAATGSVSCSLDYTA